MLKQKHWIEVIVAKTGCTKKDAKMFYDCVFDYMREQISPEELIKISGFGVLKLRKTAAKEQINLVTGKAEIVPEHYVVTFRPYFEIDPKPEAIEVEDEDLVVEETPVVEESPVAEEEVVEEVEVEAEEEAEEEAEGSEESEETEKEAPEAKPAPDFVGVIAFDNNPESVKELIERFNKQSAAFFAKHEQLVNDHKKLIDDYNTLKGRYEKLTKDYNNLKILADNRGDQLKVITGQRDYMAETLASIAKKAGIGVGYDNPQYYKDPSKSSDRIDKVSKTTLALLDNRAKMINEIVIIARDNGEKIDSALIASRPDQGLAPLRKVISKQREARKAYFGALSTIGGKLAVKFTDNQSAAYTNPQGVVNAVNNKINEARNLQNELKKAGERQRAADAKIRQLQQRIAKLEADAREFAKANKLEATGGDIEIKNWARGSVDARMATIGTVTKVSKDYGYIVIDFGTETTVIQTIGKKQIPVNPDLQSGLKFNVVRGEKFVAAVTLRIVDKKESTADIPPSKASDIQVGDKVVFAK